jgi:hypothetical protein
VVISCSIQPPPHSIMVRPASEPWRESILLSESGERTIEEKRKAMRMAWNDFWLERSKALETAGWSSERIEREREIALDRFAQNFGNIGWN